MPPEVAKYLQDVQQACNVLLQITHGKSLLDYTANVVLRLAVERSFIIIGEAILQASKLDPNLGQSISGLRQIIGFRNILVHGYAVVQDKTVWETVVNDAAMLKTQVEALLGTSMP
jgi:uncharacterized protein with HEPN domain